MACLVFADRRRDLITIEEWFGRICAEFIVAYGKGHKFPHLVSANSVLPSVVQDYRDRKIRKTNLELIIFGSSISMMKSLIRYISPLYGRRTAQINVCRRDLRL